MSECRQHRQLKIYSCGLPVCLSAFLSVCLVKIEYSVPGSRGKLCLILCAGGWWSSRWYFILYLHSHYSHSHIRYNWAVQHYVGSAPQDRYKKQYNQGEIYHTFDIVLFNVYLWIVSWIGFTYYMAWFSFVWHLAQMKWHIFFFKDSLKII